MSRILEWLSKHRGVTIALVIFYTTFCITYHEKAQQPFFWLVREKGQVYMNNLMTIVILLLSVVSIFIVAKNLIKHPAKFTLSSYLILSFILSFFAFKYLMPYNSEATHFPQYALMGSLIYPLFKRIYPSILLATMLGYLDELYQYFGRGKIYLDFNDFVLNFLGAAMGVIFMACLNKQWSLRKISFLDQLISWPSIIYFLVFTGSAIGIVSGHIGYFSDSDSSIYLLRAIKECHYYQYWYSTPWNKPWHQILPLEGICYCVGLAIIYLPIDLNKNEELDD